MERILFAEACRLWKEEKSRDVKVTTLAAYSLIIDRHLLPRFRTLEDITPESIQEMIYDETRKQLKYNTLKSIILVVKMIMKYCEEKGWKESQVYNIKTIPHNARSDPQTLSLEEEKEFVSWLKAHPTRLNIGLLTSVYCGMRVGEVCALRWEDLDLNRKVVLVRRTVYRIYDSRGKPHKTELVVGPPKTGTSWREIPLTGFLIDLILQMRGKNDECYLFSGDDSPADPQNFRNNFNRVLNTLGVPKRKVHSLRHTFATRCLESKCDFKTLSTLLGHSNVTTTLNIYAQPDLNQKRRCIEDMIKII